MQKLIQKIALPDPPLVPMTFTRLPVVHRFWAGGLLAAVAGFSLGFLLWLWHQGVFQAPSEYLELRTWHARIQILMFAGSFLLGFALQSGPHVVGGQPPPSRLLLLLLPLLWIGFFLTFVPNIWIVILGNVSISAAYGGAAYFLLRITLKGDPLRRLSRGMPLAASFVPLAMAPWLTLESADVALLVLWCGPITSVLVASQQLIQNVLGGTLLQGRIAPAFAATLLLAWFFSGVAVFTAWGSWSFAGMAWMVAIGTMAIGTGFVRAARCSGFSAINVTLILGLASAFSCAILLLIQGENLPLDVAVHLLGTGALSLLIFGVVARVVRFFSGNAVLNDRLVVYLLLVWWAVAVTRTVASLGWVSTNWVQAMSVAGFLIVMLWSFLVGLRLLQISRQIPPEITGN